MEGEVSGGLGKYVGVICSTSAKLLMWDYPLGFSFWFITEWYVVMLFSVDYKSPMVNINYRNKRNDSKTLY